MQRRKSARPAAAKQDARGKRKPTPAKRTAAGPRRHEARIRWEGDLPERDAAGNPFKRPYRLETLGSAISRTIERQERTLEPVLQEILGAAPVASLTFSYESENDHRLVFRLNAAMTNRKRGGFMFVIAKRDVDKSDLQRQEHDHLRALYRRIPKHMVRPYRGGLLFVPPRNKGEGKGRQLYWYLTQSWSSAREAYAGPNGQIVLADPKKPRLCSAAATDAIRAAICEVAVRSFDPESRTALRPPLLLAGEYAVQLPAQGRPRVIPVVCRRLAEDMNPVKLIDTLAGAGSAYEDGRHQTIPEDPTLFFKALARAVGAEQAGGWLQAYATALSTRRLKEKPGLPAEVLRALLAMD